VAFTKVLTIYQILEFNPSTILLYPSLHSPTPFSGIVSTGFFFFSIYIHMYTEFTPYSPLLTSSPLPLVSTPWGRTCSVLLFSDFAKDRKKRNDIFA
jgi:hypothetical protein